MTRDDYRNQAMANLRAMSRTANGEVDTSASANKKDMMAVTDGETAKNLALSNYEEALNMAWDNRYRIFLDPEELRSFIEDLSRQVNRGILKDGVLYRSGEDSQKYNYTPVAQIEDSALWFYKELFFLLCHESYDAVKAAATAEYYINLTIHLFADGCGKCAMVTAAWLLMRGGHPLPNYPGKEAYYSICSQFSYAQAGSDEDKKNFEKFLNYYRSLFQKAPPEPEEVEEITVILPERMSTGNIENTEAQLGGILNTVRAKVPKLDATKLMFLSSMGLRMLMRFIDEYESIAMFNVSEGIYEILEMSGFDMMMQVDRKLKQVSIDGCEIIGKGLNGSVYRYSPDTVLKVYGEKNKMADVRRENEMSRFCFVSGLPTAIPLNLVMVGERFGAMYEMLEACSLTREIIDRPDEREKLIDEYIALIKRMHTVVPESKNMPKNLVLPSHKEMFLNWALELEEAIGQETTGKLRRIIEEIPDKNTLLHGDLHPSNIMIIDGEMVLIDLDGIGLGDPIFDLANIATTLEGLPDLLHNDMLGWGDPTLRKWVMERLFKGYYSELDVAEKEAKRRLIMLCMHTRLTRYALRHEAVNESDRKEEIRKLYELVHTFD